MRRKIKKLLAVILSCICVMASSAPAFATDNDTEMYNNFKNNYRYYWCVHSYLSSPANSSEMWIMYGFNSVPENENLYLFGYDDYVNGTQNGLYVVCISDSRSDFRYFSVDEYYANINASNGAFSENINYDQTPTDSRLYIQRKDVFMDLSAPIGSLIKVEFVPGTEACVNTNIPIFRTFESLQNYLRTGDESGLVVNYACIKSDGTEKTSKTTVNSNVPNSVTAFIPKKIVLNDEENSFNTKFTGDISSGKEANMSVSSSEIVFTDESGTKTVSLPYSADKTTWSFTDIANEVLSNYSVNVDRTLFTAGKWTAQVTFDINFNDK